MDVHLNYTLSENPMSGLPIHKVKEDKSFTPEIHMSNTQENTDVEMNICDHLASQANDVTGDFS